MKSQRNPRVNLTGQGYCGRLGIDDLLRSTSQSGPGGTAGAGTARCRTNANSIDCSAGHIGLSPRHRTAGEGSPIAGGEVDKATRSWVVSQFEISVIFFL